MERDNLKRTHSVYNICEIKVTQSNSGYQQLEIGSRRGCAVVRHHSKEALFVTVQLCTLTVAQVSQSYT